MSGTPSAIEAAKSGVNCLNQPTDETTELVDKLIAENAALLAANKDLMKNFDALMADYKSAQQSIPPLTSPPVNLPV